MKRNYTARSKILFLIVFACARNSVVFAQNYVGTYAGTGASGFVNGDTASAQFRAPFGMCSDKNGNLFIADQDNNCIRLITPQGTVSTYAGTGVAGYADGPNELAQFHSPIDLCADDSGNIYVSDFENQRIRKISVLGTVTTVAGDGVAGYIDGMASSAEFNYPRGICIDPSGNLYVGDSWNHRIRKIDITGQVSTYAGGGTSMGVQSVGAYRDGSDTSARFYTPCGLCIDDAGNIFVADAYNHRVRMIDPLRVVTTIAGSGGSGSTSGGFADGAAESARFNTLTELFIDQGGNIFVGDTYNNRVRLVSGGTVSTVAGNGIAGLMNGIDSLAEFNRPRGMVLDGTGAHLFVCDNLNKVIRKITIGTATGIPQVSSSSIRFFPNPSSGIIYPSGNGLGEIEITDLSGNKVLSIKNDHMPNQLNLEFLPPGIYLIRVNTKGSVPEISKLVIAK